MPTMGAKSLLSVSLLAILALGSACNTDTDSRAPVAPDEESTFDLTGDVTAVNIQDVDVDVSIPTEGIDVDIDASIKVQLTVGVESIDQATADLCAIENGSQVIVVVTEKTDLDFDRPLSELSSLEDESIRTTGTAHKSSGKPEQDPGPSGDCFLQAETLGLVEEKPEASPSPTS